MRANLDFVKIYNAIEEIGPIRNPVLTTGTFDGVHKGHQKILSRIKEGAKKINGESILLTFHPHPRMVLFPEDNDLMLLNSQKEKLELLEAAGIDHVIIHPFTKKFSRLSSLEFVRGLLVNQIGVRKLVIGYNHHFGRNREGSLEHLLEHGEMYGFDVEEIPAQDIDNVDISSTKIRRALKEGEIQLANDFLGYEYMLNGEVVKGAGLGSQLGFPTANIKIEEKSKLLPANNVYAINAVINGKQHQGMLNIGVRPTLETNKDYQPSTSIEAHLFNFNESIYGQHVRIQLAGKIREEKKFSGLDELKEQLQKDKREAVQVLST